MMTSENVLAPVAVTMAQAAEMLGLSRASVYALADKDPTFPAFHVGGCRRVNVAALQRWADVQVARDGGTV